MQGKQAITEAAPATELGEPTPAMSRVRFGQVSKRLSVSRQFGSLTSEAAPFKTQLKLGTLREQPLQSPRTLLKPLTVAS